MDDTVFTHFFKKVTALHVYQRYSEYRRIGVFALLGVFGAVFLWCTFFSPSVHMKLGSMFFGGVPVLYNVTFAQFFFFNASHPIIGAPAPYAQYQLSRTYFIQGANERALEYAEKELETYPQNLHTHYIRGLTLGYIHREHEAIEAFDAFIAYKPGSWAARNDKAWLQFRVGDIDGALETLEPVVMQIHNPWIQNTYGTLLLNKERYDEAKNAFTHAYTAVNTMDEDAWGRAYPGNDPRVYATGLSAMKESIQKNLELVATEIGK